MQFDPNVALGLDWRKLLEEEHQRRRYDWPSQARPKQLPPPGNWSVFVLMAGRGAGKTRTGAEYIRMLAKAGNHGRIAIIGPTAADVRDVMIEGESGILAISPPDFTPAYEPSKRQLTWPNGVIGKLYSGEEPDRLRGPQHHAGWCLTGDTLILMGDGSEKPISAVSVGDSVATRQGPKRVVASQLTKRNAEIFSLKLVDGRSIMGTAEHPVWIDGIGFIPLSLASKGMQVCATRACGLKASGTTAKARRGITLRGSGCTGWSGSRPTGLFRRGTTSITRTTTRRIINSIIWSSSRSPSIASFTPKTNSARLESRLTKACGSVRPAFGLNGWPANYSAQSAVSSFQAWLKTPVSTAQINAWTRGGRTPSRERSGSAPGAWLSTRPQREFRSIAQSGAIRYPLPTASRTKSSVRSRAAGAGRVSSLRGLTRGSAAINAPSTSTQRITHVGKSPNRADVYNITVEGAHEYFANGILTHNCDEIAAWEYPETWTQFKLGFRLGKDLRCIVTSTPKPCAVIRELVKQSKQNPERVVIVRGSTYENRANLAPEFFEDIIRQYEGTRLGRQELDGELLEDTPGALWNTVILDRTRCKEQPPEMVRIVVAVDPSVTSSEDSDECGMVVCGKGVDGDAYVLADLSGVMSPHEWAQKAVAAYHEWGADCIIAETNNGGDLVGNTILAVDPSVPFRKVTASRGKVARAEPVSALFEQNRAHLVGS